MGMGTDIQWCDDTVNPVMGCDGCELRSSTRRSCYAGKLTDERFAGRKGWPASFDQPTCFPGRMEKAARWRDLTGKPRKDKPWLDGSPRLIFVSDMGDALSRAVSFEYLLKEIIATVTSDDGKRHRWPWLTKRPERMAEFSAWLFHQGINWPPNLWACTTVTTQETVHRLDHLRRVGGENTIRVLSMEPQLGPVDLGDALNWLNWIIQGGESGDEARPFAVEWALNLAEQYRSRGVPYFLKQLGSHALRDGRRLRLHDDHGGEWSEWPENLRIREVPRRLQTQFRLSA